MNNQSIVDPEKQSWKDIGLTADEVRKVLDNSWAEPIKIQEKNTYVKFQQIKLLLTLILITERKIIKEFHHIWQIIVQESEVKNLDGTITDYIKKLESDLKNYDEEVESKI